jgi:hypothetical protein
VVVHAPERRPPGITQPELAVGVPKEPALCSHQLLREGRRVEGRSRDRAGRCQRMQGSVQKRNLLCSRPLTRILDRILSREL